MPQKSYTSQFRCFYQTQGSHNSITAKTGFLFMTRIIYVRSFPASSDSSYSLGHGDWPIDPHEILLHPQELERLQVEAFGYVNVSHETRKDSFTRLDDNVDARKHRDCTTFCRVVPDDSLAPGEALVPGWIMRCADVRATENMRVSRVKVEDAEFPSCSHFTASFIPLDINVFDAKAKKYPLGERLSALTPSSLEQAIARRVAGCLVCVGSFIAAEILGHVVTLRVTEIVGDGPLTSSSHHLDTPRGSLALESPKHSEEAVVEPRRPNGASTGLGEGRAILVGTCKVASGARVTLQQMTNTRSGVSPDADKQRPLDGPSLARDQRPKEEPNIESKDSSTECEGKVVAWSERAPSLEVALNELQGLVLLVLGGMGRNASASKHAQTGKSSSKSDASCKAGTDPWLAGSNELLVSDVLPKGIALCGPSGVGKSLVLDVVCDDLRVRHGVHAVRLRGPQILAGINSEGTRGNSESKKAGTFLTRALDEARGNAPAVLVIDELDAVLDSMGSEDGSHLGEGVAAGAALLAVLDAASSTPGVVVLAATRRSPGGVQGAEWTDVEAEGGEGRRSAMPTVFRKPGRFDKFVEMVPPSQSDRGRILHVLLQRPGWKLEALTPTRFPADKPKGGNDPAWPPVYDTRVNFDPGPGAQDSTSDMPPRSSGGMLRQGGKRGEDTGREMTEEGLDGQAAIALEWAERLSSVTPGMLAGDLHRLVQNMRVRAARRESGSAPRQAAASSSGAVDRAELKTLEPVSMTSARSVVTWRDALEAVASTVPRVLRGMDVTSSAGGGGAGSGPTWASVGGFVEARRRLQRLVQWPWQHRGAFERMGISAPAGALLFGPSGCGKSLVAQVLANECRANFVSVRSSELLSRYLGETEAKLRALFARARSAAPCILFIDELDAITAKRGDGEGGDAGGGAAGVHARVLSTLLNEMDGISGSMPRSASRNGDPRPRGGDRGSVLVLAATNRRDALDAALLRPGRLHESVELGMPGREDREGVLRVHASRLPVSGAVDLERLSGDDVSGGLTCADIEASCRDAAMMALRENLQGAHEVEPEHLRKALHARAVGRLKTRSFTFSLGKASASR